MMIKNYIKLCRISDWIKNIFLFVPIVFSKNLLDVESLFTVFIAFLSFSFLSSAIYVINDIIDIEADRNHPIKKNRPLPSGKISRNLAIMLAIILIVISVLFGFKLSYYFHLSLIIYFLLNLIYSLSLKHIVIIDIFCIAAGFMIRVAAGAYAIDVEISSWLILTTMFLSLFLAVMKRRAELTLNNINSISSTRKVLENYSINFTDQMATVTAAGVIICYALYSVSSRTISVFNTENLIYTTPFVVFGIFRYMFLVIHNQKGERTAEAFLTDKVLLINVMLYIFVTILIIYN